MARSTGWGTLSKALLKSRNRDAKCCPLSSALAMLPSITSHCRVPFTGLQWLRIRSAGTQVRGKPNLHNALTIVWAAPDWPTLISMSIKDTGLSVCRLFGSRFLSGHAALAASDTNACTRTCTIMMYDQLCRYVAFLLPESTNIRVAMTTLRF